MKIEQASTAIEHYHDRVLHSEWQKAQIERVFEVILQWAYMGGPTIREIAEATGIADNVVSARIGNLRDAKRVEAFSKKRKCTVTGTRKKTWVPRALRQSTVEFDYV